MPLIQENVSEISSQPKRAGSGLSLSVLGMFHTDWFHGYSPQLLMGTIKLWREIYFCDHLLWFGLPNIRKTELRIIAFEFTF